MLESCPSGFAIRQLLPDGSVVCAELGGDSSGGAKLVTNTITRMGSLEPGQPLNVSVMCPDGYITTAGGYVGTPQIQVYSSYALDSRSRGVSALNTGRADLTPGSSAEEPEKKDPAHLPIGEAGGGDAQIKSVIASERRVAARIGLSG